MKKSYLILGYLVLMIFFSAYNVAADTESISIDATLTRTRTITLSKGDKISIQLTLNSGSGVIATIMNDDQYSDYLSSPSTALYIQKLTLTSSEQSVSYTATDIDSIYIVLYNPSSSVASVQLTFTITPDSSIGGGSTLYIIIIVGAIVVVGIVVLMKRKKAPSSGTSQEGSGSATTKVDKNEQKRIDAQQTKDKIIELVKAHDWDGVMKMADNKPFKKITQMYGMTDDVNKEKYTRVQFLMLYSKRIIDTCIPGSQIEISQFQASIGVSMLTYVNWLIADIAKFTGTKMAGKNVQIGDNFNEDTYAQSVLAKLELLQF